MLLKQYLGRIEYVENHSREGGREGGKMGVRAMVGEIKRAHIRIH